MVTFSPRKLINKIRVCSDVPVNTLAQHLQKKFSQQELLHLNKKDVLKIARAASITFIVLGVLFLTLSSIYSLPGLLIFILGVATLTTGFSLYRSSYKAQAHLQTLALPAQDAVVITIHKNILLGILTTSP